MPDSNHKATEASRHVGAAELTPRPTVAAKVTRIEDTAVAVRAPAIIGVHCNVQGSSSRLATGVASRLIVKNSYRKPKNDRMNMMMTMRPTR